MVYRSTLPLWNIRGETILLRADLNVPLHGNTIIDDTKLIEIRTTLDYLVAKQAKIIIMTHIGRPTGTNPSLSTKLLLPWFVHNNYQIEYAADIEDAHKKMAAGPCSSITMMENLRFFAGEKTQDHCFAQSLRALGEFYVHDGFAVMHTHDTSNTLLPDLFDVEHKTIGFHATQELNVLHNVIHHISHPLLIILGGSKLNTKIEYIKKFIEIADAIVLFPAVAFTFLKAQGVQVGRSLVDERLIKQAHNILCYAEKNNKTIILPSDIQIEEQPSDYSIVPVDDIPANAYGISIGPRTIECIVPLIHSAQTIIYNGAVGFLECKETLTGMKNLLQLIATSDACTLVVGGDTSTIVRQQHMSAAYTYSSTAGGAVLAYSIHHTLPALQALSIEWAKTK